MSPAAIIEADDNRRKADALLASAAAAWLESGSDIDLSVMRTAARLRGEAHQAFDRTRGVTA